MNMSDGKTINAREFRDPACLPDELRRIAKKQSSAEARDILEHAADELARAFSTAERLEGK
jgi:hypothetical protein